jgi:hypothetical protein
VIEAHNGTGMKITINTLNRDGMRRAPFHVRSASTGT